MLSKATNSLFRCAKATLSEYCNTARYITTTTASKTIKEYQSKLVVDCNNTLGECPIWDYRRQLLCWIDIEQAKFWSYDPQTQQSSNYDLPERPGAFALCDNTNYDIDTYLFAFEKGPYFYNISKQTIIGERIFDIHQGSRANDGRVDKEGRFIFGGLDEPMNPNNPKRSSFVYRINKDLTYEQLLDIRVACTNSVCFSIDGRTMFFTDTFGPYETQRIFNYNYYKDNKKPDNCKIYKIFNECYSNKTPEYCDGSIIDSDNCLWSSFDTIVHVPEPFVTCAAFGDKDLDTLYITTLDFGKDNEMMTGNEKGGLYSVKLPIKGNKEDVFLGQ